jgi:hypothetical protein
MNDTLDFHKFKDDQYVPVWRAKDSYGHRMIIKRGGLTKVNFNEKSEKSTKKKVVEVFLFSDYFMYATVNREKKTGNIKYLVFEMVHRSLVSCSAWAGKKKEDPVKGAMLVSLPPPSPLRFSPALGLSQFHLAGVN